MKNSLSRNKNEDHMFFIVFFFIYILSNGFSIIFNATSLRSSLVSGIIFFSILLLITNKLKLISINRKYLFYILMICIILFVQGLLSLIVDGDNGIDRCILSIIALLVTIIVSAFFTNLVVTTKEESLNISIIRAYKFMTFIGGCSIILHLFGLTNRINMFIFFEPSHYALVYLPLVLYMVYTANNNQKIIYLFISLLLAIVIENSTLLIGVFLIFLLVYWKYKFKLLVIVIIGIILINTLSLEKIQYFTDRFNISMQSNNLSVLAWISGWERAGISLIDSLGMGIGFQRLGYVGESGAALDKIYRLMNGSYLTLKDGSTVGAKLIAENGVVGIFLIFWYLKYFFEITRLFVKHKIEDRKSIFYYSIYIMFFIQIFVRGTGYFSPASFLFFSSIYWLYKFKIQQK